MIARLMQVNEYGEECGYNFEPVYSKQEIIEYMADKNPDDYVIDLFAPGWFEYDENLLTNGEFYLIQYSTFDSMRYIQLFLKEEYEITEGRYY